METKGLRWHCTNPACLRIFVAQDRTDPEGAPPVCSCGAPLKKEYKPPVFRYLEFLSLDQEELAPHATTEE